MTERVQTGGTRTFDYGKGHNPKFSEEERNEIAQAYVQARERKAREKKQRNIIIIVVLIILLATIGYFLLF